MKPMFSLIAFALIAVAMDLLPCAQQDERTPTRIEQLKVEKAGLLKRIAEINEELTKLSSSKNTETTMKISLTSVFVDNPIKAFKFYTEVLGFVKKVYVPEAELAVVASPEEPDGTGLLLEPRGTAFAKTYQESVYKAGFPVIVFGVEDIQKEYERLKKLGVVFKSEPTKTEWGTQALFEDTCGNFIQLHQE